MSYNGIKISIAITKEVDTGLNSDRIEELAIWAVKGELLKDECLTPYISEQDKEPSWDGHIYVYNSGQKTKDNLYRRVPVQVKGKEAKQRFGGKTRSFPCEIADLINWSNEGGVFLFVVEVNEDTANKIYCTDLLSIDINNLLDKTTKGQQTKNVIVKELKPRRLKISLLTFAENKDKQVGRVPIPIEKINQLCEMTFGVKIESIDTFNPADVVDTDVVMYGKINPQDQPAPLSRRAHIMSLIRPLNQVVKVNGKTYYNDFKFETTKDTRSFIFGKSTKIDLGKDKTQMHFNLMGNIYEAQNDCEFIVNFLNSGTLTLGDSTGPSLENTKERKETLQKFSNILDFLNNAIKVFEYFHIVVNKDFLQYSKEDFLYLETLIYILQRHKKTAHVEIQTGLNILTIGDIRFACTIVKENDDYIAYNYFSDFYKRYRIITQAIISPEKPPIQIEIFPYVDLKADGIVNLANFDEQVVLDSIKRIPMNEHSLGITNQFLLEVILAYDTKKDTQLLTLAEGIVDLLLDNDSKNHTFQLNKYQIIKRQRQLSRSEKDILYKLRDQSQSEPETLAGIAILLENRSDFELNFEKLESEKEENFKQYPIYHLLK